jgi:hypothetical protein
MAQSRGIAELLRKDSNAPGTRGGKLGKAK